MGHPPLAEVNEISELRAWLHVKGIRKIEDISEWDSHGNWQWWKFPRTPEYLQMQLEILFEAISDFAPVHKEEEDSWG